MRLLLAGLLLAGSAIAETWSYWIEPCTAELAKQSGCTSADAELGVWALEAWQKAAAGELRVIATPEENRARIRIYWAWGTQHLYGEARPIVVDGKRGAAVYVIPDMARLGPDIDAVAKRDPLFRDTVVYLTCLHESGHALVCRTPPNSPTSCTVSDLAATSSNILGATGANSRPARRYRISREFPLRTARNWRLFSKNRNRCATMEVCLNP